VVDEKDLNDHNDDGNQEHEYRDPVYAMHIFHPLGIWQTWIPFFQVEIFCKLS
jgi:hypothetical protein